MNQQDCDFLNRILSGNIEWIAAEMWLDNLKLKDCERIKNDLVADIVATKLTGGNVNFTKQRVLDYLQDKSAETRHLNTPKHYNSTMKDEDLTNIFEHLKNNGYVNASSDLGMWLYICKGGNLNGDFIPIQWLKTTALLALMCDTLFMDTDNDKIWEIAIFCFCKKNGERYSANSLSQALSRHDKGSKDNGNNMDKHTIKGADALSKLLMI